MSILIKNMEMPKTCEECDFAQWSNFHQTVLCNRCDYEPVCREYGTDYKRRRASFCPLVEVPTPHGRLIDADELINDCEKLMRMLDPESKEYLRVFAIKSYLMWAAEYAVIEAEGREK